MPAILFSLAVIRSAALAILPCVAKDLNRPYLHGALLESDSTRPNGFNLVATDEHKLGLFKMECLPCVEVPTVSKTLPLEALKYLAAIKVKAADTVKITLDERATITVMQANADIETRAFSLPGTTFPDYRRFMPDETSEDFDSFDAAYMEALCGGAKKAGAKCVAVSHNLRQGGPSRIYTDLEGLSYVIMPRRAGASLPTPAPFEDLPPAQQLKAARLLWERASRSLIFGDHQKESKIAALIGEVETGIKSAYEANNATR